MANTTKTPPMFDAHSLSVRTCFAAVSCLLVWGCLATAAAGAWDVWPFKKDDQPGKPDKVMAVWSDTILTQAGRTPIRGFGGRLMFYESQKEAPIKVEGTLIVYCFDESGRHPDNNKPDRKYVFRRRSASCPLQQIQNRPLLQRLAALGRSGGTSEGNHADRPL